MLKTLMKQNKSKNNSPGPEDPHGVVVQHVNKFFGKKHVLKDIDLEILHGQIYGLLGPSGCGKTTVVKIIAGILEATSGEAYVLGEKMPQLSLMNKVGYMAQSDALYGSLTAEENLQFFGAIYGMSKGEIKKRTVEVMELVNLTEHLHKPVQAFSGGMKRRLSLAIAILHNPPVLVLDEPTVGIDPLLRRDIWAELNTLAGQGVTILVTTHVMDEADKCHSLAMMRDGRLIAKGTSRELQERIGVNSIEEAFIYYGGQHNES
ncbi:ABC-type multidrug transport system, ATPase component [Desulfitobacterium dehalogenans ATCC 51507]|uniref:ABC-type multidrug transport system, ATPase component n=1 Tax=Desulfitobacterium dehalogenans (strain ATCC 51507 / DSM 9161 / JW/IU-DC1) TaxID=756499 RepID=I4A7Y0_DESDJ|nr:ABC transporter ATP-binding protein [Desulfitobacterium dehalogenans]AFM00065.1 ABC-type multidrug transport system, ATPase component [Desulfitobacterium dehalogenans ATCC 51507]